MSGRIPVMAIVAEAAGLVLLPFSMACCVMAGVDQVAGASMVASVASLLLLFASYEWRSPSLRETMPVVVLAALAAAGRIIFAPFGHVKPVSAISIVAGAVFGRQSGFMVGALSALVSNFFFGQGAWTPWQMYAWGLIGWLAGVLAARGLFKRTAFLYGYGMLSGWLYGLVMNVWSFFGFYHPHTLSEALVIMAPAVPLDTIHGVATVVFLMLLWGPWHRKLARLKVAYGLHAG